MAPKQSSLAKRRARLIPLSVISRPEQDVAYGRVSSDLQREQETIETQKILLLGDINSRDRDDLPESQRRKLVGQFWDDGVTGTIPLEQRPEGSRLVRLICDRGDITCEGDCGSVSVVDAVWVTKLDRLARRLQILIDIERFFRLHGVGLRSLEFNIDTSDPTGKMIFQLLGIIAEWEHGIILQRTRGGRRTKAAEGKFVGGRRTFGFKTDEHGYLVVDETLIEGVNMTACQIVKEIFENVALHGSSAWRESQRFSMTERRVQGILHNPRYKGETGMLSDGEWLPATRNLPEQIVTPEVWDLAQTALLDNRRRSSRNRQYTYLLSQLMICCEPWSHTPVFDEDGVKIGRNPKLAGLCGRVFQGRIENRPDHRAGGKAERHYTYYFCTRQGCTAKPLRGRDVEDAVWALVDERIRHPEQFIEEALRRRDNDRIIGELRTEIAGIIERLAHLESERQNVLRSGDKGHRTEREVDTRLAEIAAEIAPLQDHRTALQMQLHGLTLSATDMRRAGVSGADAIAQLDQINAMMLDNDPAVVAKGRARAAALIHASVRTIEIRTAPNKDSVLSVYMYVTRGLPIALPLETGGNHLQLSVNPPISSNQSDNDQLSDNIVVREVVIPRPPMGPPPSPRQSAA